MALDRLLRLLFRQLIRPIIRKLPMPVVIGLAAVMLVLMFAFR